MGSPISPYVSDGELRKEVALSPEKHVVYRSIVSSIQYISTKSRPDIAFSTSILGSFVFAPTTVYMAEEKRILRYLGSTKDKISIKNPRTSNQLAA